MKKISIKKLVTVALLIGLNIVFSRLISISAWNFKISLTFVTVYIAAYLFGPLYGALVGGLGDMLGALLFPIGPFNPLFTITALLTGCVFGIFNYKKTNITNTIMAVLINQLGVSLLLNTYFISVTYDSSYLALLTTRVIQSIVMIVIQFVVIKAIQVVLPRFESVFKDE